VDWPDESNLFGSLQTALSRERVAGLFASFGWEARKCSWTDYEVVCDFAELVIESENPILIHGPVADLLANLPRIIEPLARAGVAYSLECYDENRGLIYHARG
jgi:hypothetical protein